MGERYHGIPITEENRATVWEFRTSGILTLQKILKENYLDKHVPAVLFGVYDTPEQIKYAVFVKQGFLVDVPEEE